MHVSVLFNIQDRLKNAKTKREERNLKKLLMTPKANTKSERMKEKEQSALK